MAICLLALEIGKLIIGYKHEYIDLYDYINDNNKVNQLFDKLKDIKNEENSLVSLGISTGFDGGHSITLVNINNRYITIKDPHGKTPKNLDKIKDIIIQESSIEQNEKNRIKNNFEKTGLLEVPSDFLKKKKIYEENGISKERALFDAKTKGTGADKYDRLRNIFTQKIKHGVV